ncbi:Ig-like and fibronectin type-III domain-containing protein C25G4.10 [Aphelenchoides besseyi]|nr:Ig-like and fibronectin type-III domain-containing protein C25G4.10 [Aphelenchoides besseyi]KAI6235503.1 Ig-like and fibronectin type-III domain-containing protein C25G4.10 [Aphelenchoides besseyi]
MQVIIGVVINVVRISSFLFFVFRISTARTVDECCRSHNLPDICVQTLCYPLNPPGDFEVYNIFEKRTNCSKHLPEIAQCLADGRHHLHCCKSEAKDYEENACFGLCEGVGKTESSWKDYQTCLAINLPSMFLCFQKGYASTPSPPLNPRLDSIETTSITLTWETPEHNANEVTRYRVVVIEQSESKSDKSDDDEEEGNSIIFLDGKTTKQLETEVVGLTSARIENLIPGTLYNAHIIAIGSTPTQHSLSSDMLDFQTVGISPRVEPYKEVTHAPANGKSVVIACRFYMSSVSHSTADLTWHLRAKNGAEFVPVNYGPRFNFSHYVASYRPREYIMMLQILDLRNTDFGIYRCGVKDKYGEANVELQLETAAVHVASDNPPSTPLDCCRERGVERRCLSMCGAVEKVENRRYIPRPYMPQNCSTQISKVLSCAMPGIDDGGCCLMENVPRPCMYLCDSSVAPSNRMDSLCIRFMSAVERCRVRGVEKRPGLVVGLRTQNNAGTDILLVQWNHTSNAEIYYVYWRRHHDSKWHQQSTTETSKKVIGGADEVALVAANSYGISQAAWLKVGSSS